MANLGMPRWMRAVMFFVALLLANSRAFAADAYSFAVVPQFEQRKLFAIWKPVIDELEKRTGLNFKLVATLTVPAFERELEKGGFDFVYANPYHILRVSASPGYIPLVRDEAPLRGILVVRKDNPIRDMAGLDGKKLAIPSPNALGASLLLRADLAQLFRVTMVPVNVKTHSSVYLHVANGLVDAGGGVEKTLQEQSQEVRDALRVLYTTRDMPSHPVAAHPRVNKADREKVRRAFLDMSATVEGRAMLAKVPMSRAVSTSIEDYLPMRAWGLEPLWAKE